MSAALSLTAIAALGALVVWVAGLVALRATGMLLALAGLAGFAMQTGAPASTLTLALELPVWLAGHWLYAYRHHEHAGPLANRPSTTHRYGSTRHATADSDRRSGREAPPHRWGRLSPAAPAQHEAPLASASRMRASALLASYASGR